MQNKLIITKQKEKILSIWVEDEKIRQIQAEPVTEEGILGNIYVGKVANVIKNLNAAFVEFQKGQMGYLPLDKLFCSEISAKDSEPKVRIGGEIIVQVEKEAIKTKPPTLTGHFELTGKYVILIAGKKFNSISGKITKKADRQRLQAIFDGFSSNNNGAYGWIARTNSQTADTSLIQEEMQKLARNYQSIVQRGMHRSMYHCLYRSPVAYLENIKSMYVDCKHEIITDSEQIYQEVAAFIKMQQWEEYFTVSLWDMRCGDLCRVYRITSAIQKALQPKVWLKHGGYLVIQQTEAFAAIDVNSGKGNTVRKNMQKNFLKVNLEAAVEIAQQIRLRNLSGIILVDFIDMLSEEDNNKLLDTLRREFEKDPIPTKLIDMTKLGLVEITRKKIRKSLSEQLRMPPA